MTVGALTSRAGCKSWLQSAPALLLALRKG